MDEFKCIIIDTSSAAPKTGCYKITNILFYLCRYTNNTEKSDLGITNAGINHCRNMWSFLSLLTKSINGNMTFPGSPHSVSLGAPCSGIHKNYTFTEFQCCLNHFFESLPSCGHETIGISRLISTGPTKLPQIKANSLSVDKLIIWRLSSPGEINRGLQSGRGFKSLII